MNGAKKLQITKDKNIDLSKGKDTYYLSGERRKKHIQIDRIVTWFDRRWTKIVMGDRKNGTN